MVPILSLIPGSDEGMKKLAKFGQGLAQVRVKAGSERKDLIYYLVRPNLAGVDRLHLS